MVAPFKSCDAARMVLVADTRSSAYILEGLDDARRKSSSIFDTFTAPDVVKDCAGSPDPVLGEGKLAKLVSLGASSKKIVFDSVGSRSDA